MRTPAYNPAKQVIGSGFAHLFTPGEKLWLSGKPLSSEHTQKLLGFTCAAIVVRHAESTFQSNAYQPISFFPIFHSPITMPDETQIAPAGPKPTQPKAPTVPAVRDSAAVAASLEMHQETGLGAVAATQLRTQGLSLNFGDPQSVLDAAKLLTKFVKDNKLSSNISGKDYANVEAWQFLFMLAGYDVVIEHCKRDMDANWLGDAEGNPIKQYVAYTASAALFDKDGRLVGRGIAYCTNEPGDKGGYQQYAVMSFAQTRAVGKAGRNKFGFILKSAGFEATPVEETTQMQGESQTGAVEVTTVGKPAGKRRPGQPAPAKPIAEPEQITDVTPEEVAQPEADHTVEPVVADAAPEPDQLTDPATKEQKERIISLANHVTVPKPNKDAILQNLPTCSREKADEVIQKLETFITKNNKGIAPGPIRPAGAEAATSPQPAAEAEVTTLDPANPPAPQQEFATDVPAPQTGAKPVGKPAGAKRPSAPKPPIADVPADEQPAEEQPAETPKIAFTGEIAKRMIQNLQQDGVVALDAIKDRFRAGTYSYTDEQMGKFNVALTKVGYSLGAEFGFEEYQAPAAQ